MSDEPQDPPPQSAAEAAAAWWNQLDDTRRAQIHRWITARHHKPPIPGQTDLLTELDRNTP